MIEIPQEIKKILKEIGLDMAEQQVVFHLFKNGVSKIADISSSVKLPRTTIHLAVENLIERNVLGVAIVGRRRMIYIEKPEKIRKLVEYEQIQVNKKMAELESIMPELRSFFAIRGEREQIDVEHLEGEDGFVEVFFRSLDQDKGGEILRIHGDTESFTVARDRLKSFGNARRKKGILARNLMTESPLSQDEINESKIKLRETRVLSKSILNPNLHFTIWKNHVSFTVWDQGLRSVIITNKSIYDFMKMMFEIAWAQASDKISEKN